MKKYGGGIIKRICDVCGEEFQVEHPNQKRCKGKCKIIGQKRGIKRRNKRRNEKDSHKEYMAQYMFRWRRKYRKSSYKQENGKNGTDTGGAHPKILDENGTPVFIEERDLVQKQKRRSLGKI